MSDTVIELVRAVIITIITLWFLLSVRKKTNILLRPGWFYLSGGFSLLVFAAIIDFTDNFSSLNHFLIIGDTPYKAFLENVIGYPGGLLLLSLGIRKLLPNALEKKESEGSLQHALDRTHKSLEFLTTMGPAVIFSAKPYGDFGASFISENIESITGYHASDFIDDPGLWMKKIHPKDKAKAREGMEKLLLKDHSTREYRFRHRDGVWRWIMDEMKLIRDYDGCPREIVGYITDITEKKKSEEALEASEQRYRKLFEDSKDTVFIVTTDGRFIDINPAGVDLLGFSTKKELMEANLLYDICDSTPEVRAKFMETIEEQGFVKDFEVRMKKSNGERLVSTITADSIKDKDGAVTGLRCILRDITEHKLLEEQLLQAQKMEAVGQLTGGIAHDFNNMVMAIMMYSELLKKELKGNNPARRNVEKISEVTRRAEGLTQRLLAFSRKQVLSPVPVDLNKIVESVEKLLLRFIGEDIDLKTELSSDPITVLADSGQIEQVLMNLATNARDAMPEGGALFISTGVVNLTEEDIRRRGYGGPGTYASIKVVDTGVGMDKATCKKIFEPFFTTKGVGKGTGLGLSVAYGIIKQHRGYIEVSSTPGGGTAFGIFLPIVESFVTEEEPSKDMIAALGTETVLLAEDDAEVRSITRTVLEENGYRVIEAIDGEDAVKKFIMNRENIHLVILDVIMPRRNGKEAYEKILELRPGMKTLFMSGYTEDIIDRNGINGGGLNFLSKPVTPATLLTIVREVLAN